MTSMEKTSKRKIRISIIDVLIVLAVIACIAGTFVHYKIFETRNTVETDDVCLVQVRFSETAPEVAERLVEGDTVYFSEDGKLFGEIVEIASADALSYYRNAEDKIVRGTDSTKKDVSVAVKVKGGVTSDGFFVGGTDYVAAGMEIDVFTPKFSGKGLIFDVKKQTE